MWLRTTMNYQYRYGTKLGETFSKLYNEGGIRRFYRGIGPALFMDLYLDLVILSI